MNRLDGSHLLVNLKLIESYLKAGVMETGKGWEATPEGTPQGGVSYFD